jgi:hypothetical protein
LVINIAQYHQEENADLTKTMKVVLTNTNGQVFEATYNIGQLLVYFETDFNRKIRPGDAIWPPGQSVPRRSPQVFAEYMGEEELLASLEPIEGSNLTTALWEATTIDNPAYGVRAGQKVEVLLININEPSIPTVIVGSNLIQKISVPLANMAQHIAANQELLSRVQDFFGTSGANDAGSSSSESDSSSGTTPSPTSPSENTDEESMEDEGNNIPEGGAEEVLQPSASSSFSLSRQSYFFFIMSSLFVSLLTLNNH